MRIVPFLISTAVTVGCVLALNHRWDINGNKTPRLGKFLSPQTGFWQNAEPADADFSMDIKSPLLQDKVDVYLDDRLVPHVFAQNEHDVYFVQGYLHAKFRLWQMEFQTHVAAGRLSELIGETKGNVSILNTRDRNFRRLGMVIGAEKSLKAIESDPESKMVLDAYTQGINSYIENLKPENFPVEYKLLDYAPEKWTNLKTALFLKYMSHELAAFDNDFENTKSMELLTKTAFEKAYPYGQDSLEPIIPKGTIFEKPGLTINAPTSVDSLYFHFSDSIPVEQSKPDPQNGSNNWAVAGSKTASGKPILCGDPHLGLNLPSLWFEMQLHTPQWNTYGVSFPGAPAVPIGFNDSIAWSETNAGRDVRDYYEIRFKDGSEKEYWFNGAWKQTEWRIDTIKRKDAADFIDSIPLTVFGPVMYDKNYENKLKNNKAYAVRWKAQDPSNESLTFIKLARANNYNDYVDALKTYECPGQNFVFASKSGDIAMWNQGAFPAKWYRQGDFIMPGEDSSYMWQGIIPMNENPHMINPERGFVSSANQLPAEVKAYPYYLGGHWDLYRGVTINKMLSSMSGITAEQMEKMQNDNFNQFAATAVPVLLKNINDSSLTAEQKKYIDLLRQWNLRGDAHESSQTVFSRLLFNLYGLVWDDDIKSRTDLPTTYPDAPTLIEAIIKDSAFSFIDNRNTPQKETLRDVVMQAVQKTTLDLDSLVQKGYNLSYETWKDTEVDHLLKMSPFSKLDIRNGGGTHMINATNKTAGPSWRMVVELTDKTKAWGVYPGGQSGNPGSRFYDNFIDSWASGAYYPLWVMTAAESSGPNVKWKMNFTKS